MAKIKLDVDALQVESFTAEEAPSARGTVHAREYTIYDGCQTYAGCLTSLETCAGYDCTRATLCMNSCELMCIESAGAGSDDLG